MQRLHPERRPRRHRVVLLVAAFLAAIAFLAGAARAGDATVVIDNFAFSPSTLTVKTGTTVTWRNSDDIPHTVASVKRAFKSKALETSDSFSFTFDEAGAYAYFCSLLPQ
jgi:plastocyanin